MKRSAWRRKRATAASQTPCGHAPKVPVGGTPGKQGEFVCQKDLAIQEKRGERLKESPPEPHRFNGKNVLSRRPGVPEALLHPRACECGTRIPSGPHRYLRSMGKSSLPLKNFEPMIPHRSRQSDNVAGACRNGLLDPERLGPRRPLFRQQAKGIMPSGIGERTVPEIRAKNSKNLF